MESIRVFVFTNISIIIVIIANTIIISLQVLGPAKSSHIFRTQFTYVSDTNLLSLNNIVYAYAFV